MIATVDLSNWNSPYDMYVFDWPQISGGWEKMQREGLAGGTLVGNVLGLGQEESAPVPGPAVCDFTQGDLVLQVQAALGVPATGVFDEATCLAWQEEYGTVPDAAALQAVLPVPCGTLLAPVCQAKERALSNAAMLGIGFYAVAAGLILYARTRR